MKKMHNNYSQFKKNKNIKPPKIILNNIDPNRFLANNNKINTFQTLKIKILI